MRTLLNSNFDFQKHNLIIAKNTFMARGQYFLQFPIDKFEAIMIKDEIMRNKELDIFVSSIGGDVNAGVEIFNMIQAAEKNGKDIHTHLLSNADSIASVIMVAPKKENRHVVESSMMFIHEPRFMFVMDVDQKKAVKIDGELEKQKNRMADIYVRQIEGLSKDEALALMAGEKNLTAQEMLDFGIVGEVKEVLDIAAQRNQFNNNKMGLFNKKDKVVVGMVATKDGEKTFVYEGELAVNAELTQVGLAEAKLEGDIVIMDGRTLKVDAENKVTEIVEASASSGGGDSVIIDAVAQMIVDSEARMLSNFDAKIEALRKTGSNHKVPKTEGGTGAGAQKTTAQSVRDVKAKMKERIEAKRNA